MLSPATLLVTLSASAVRSMASGQDPSLQEAFYLASTNGLFNIGLQEPSTHDVSKPQGGNDIEPKQSDGKSDSGQHNEVNDYYTHSLDSANQGKPKVDYDVVKSNEISNSTTHGEGPRETKTIVEKQFIVDHRYTEYGNLLDFCSNLRKGHLEFDDFLLAMVDVVDAVTFQMLRPYLMQYKTNSHLQERYVKYVFDKGQFNTSNNFPDQKVIAESQNKGGNSKEHTEKSETTTSRQIDTSTEVQQVTRNIYAPQPVQEGGKDRLEDIDILQKKPETTETHAVIKNTETTSEKTKIEITNYTSRKFLGWDLGDFLGKNIESHNTQTVEKKEGKVSVYTVDQDTFKAFQDDQRISSKELEELRAKKVETAELPSSEKVDHSIGETGFSEGYVAYIPCAGGILNVVAKADLGVDVTKKDIFWAAMDGVEVIALGYGTLLKSALKIGMKDASKALAKGAAKKVAHETSEQVAKKATKEVAEKTTEKVGKETAEEVTEKGALKTSKHSDESHIGLQNSKVNKSTSGGSYEDLAKNRNPGEEIHHCPSASVNNMPFEKGPCIRMDKLDHRRTASYGSSKDAQVYRQKQKELIEQGKFKEGQQMDIDDVRSKFGNKYDDGIAEMQEHSKSQGIYT